MEEKHGFEQFTEIVARLRGRDGCPWDKAQTMESLKPCMINEMTEAIGGIDLYQKTGNPANLCEELGDVLLQVVLLSRIAQEEGLFTIEDVIEGIARKMVRRHPHVFGSQTASGEEVPGQWEEIKKAEKAERPLEWEQLEKKAFLEAAEQVTEALRISSAKILDKSPDALYK